MPLKYEKTEAEKLEFVKKNGLNIQVINNPSEAIQLAAVEQNFNALFYIKNPCELAQIVAMKKDPGYCLFYYPPPVDFSKFVLDTCKNEILKYVLYGIKEGFIGSPDHEILNRLKKVDWPELKVIQKSLNAKNTVNEAIKLNDKTEVEQIRAVNQDPYIIEFIKNPSETVQLAAVEQTGCSIRYIKNPSEKVKLAAVNQTGYSIEFISNPSEAVQLVAVNKNSRSIQYIKNPSEAVQLAAVTKYGLTVQYIKNPSEAVQLAAVEQAGYNIRFIKNPSEAVQLAAVNKNGYNIHYIKNPSEAVQIAAVKQNGSSIQFINNPSESFLNKCKYEIIKYILLEIKNGKITLVNNPLLILLQKKVNWPELDVIKKSLSYKLLAESNDLDDKSEAEQLKAIDKSWLSIKYIENPSLKLQLAAVAHNSFAILHIRGILDETIIAAIKNEPGIISYCTRLLSKYILDACKEEIIAYLLTGLKTSDLSINEILNLILFDLRPHVNWPELETIKRSLYAIKNSKTSIG